MPNWFKTEPGRSKRSQFKTVDDMFIQTYYPKYEYGFKISQVRSDNDHNRH